MAAGTGDWVAAHAAAEAGEANWGALELRHDRVYSIFSRMLLGNHPNLCVMGGDAAAILRNHVKRASVRHIFINFPEPPTGASHAADAAAMAEASDSALHLLTPPFFRAMHAALEPGGRITILSDNEGYCRALAATAAALRDGESGCSSPNDGGAERLAVIDGVHVYKCARRRRRTPSRPSRTLTAWEHGQPPRAVVLRPGGGVVGQAAG